MSLYKYNKLLAIIYSVSLIIGILPMCFRCPVTLPFSLVSLTSGAVYLVCYDEYWMLLLIAVMLLLAIIGIVCAITNVKSNIFHYIMIFAYFVDFFFGVFIFFAPGSIYANANSIIKILFILTLCTDILMILFVFCIIKKRKSYMYKCNF